MPEPRVTVILVTYNSSHCIDSALASLPADVASVVVDNGSSDDTLAIARRRANHVVAIPRNVGFGRGCNAGAAIADSEFLLMMNPDTQVQGDAIATLVTAAERYPTAAAFNPLLIRAAAEAGAADGHDRIVATLSGAALFVRKRLYDEVGGFDERFFLYFEDTDLSARLAAKGGLMQIAGACFVHSIGQSSRLTFSDEFRKYRHYGNSRVYYSSKYDQSFNRSREALSQGLKAIHRLLLGRARLAARHLGRAVGYAEGMRLDR